MMRQYFQNLAAEAGVSEILLVGDKAILPSFNRRTSSLTISFASSCVDTRPTSSTSKFENVKDDFAPSFPIRKLSSGSLTSKSSSSSSFVEPLFNSRWVSDNYGSPSSLTRSQSFSPVSKTRSHRRKLSEELSIEIKSVIIGDNTINNNANEEQQEEKLRVSPVAPKRKASIEDCSIFHAAAIGLRRSHSADLVA